MPAGNYDRFFGGRPGSAAKAHAAMRSQYGDAEGDRIFYALLAKRRQQGKGRGLAGVMAEKQRMAQATARARAAHAALRTQRRRA